MTEPTLGQVMQALRAADAAGNTDDARRLARIAADMTGMPRQDVRGRIEAALQRQPTIGSERRREQADAIATGMMEAAGRENLVQNEPVFSRLAAASEGIPFVGQWLDEAAGLVSPNAQERIRAARLGMQEQHPVQSGLLQFLTGAVATAPVAAAAAPRIVAQGGTVAGNAIRGLLAGGASGAVEGAVSGAGAGDNEDRGQTSLQYAGIGGALGGLLGGAAPVVSAGVRSALSRFRTTDVDVIARQLGISRGAATVVRDAIRAEDFGAAQDAIQRAGGRAMLADMGEATRTLLDAAMTSGPEAAATARRAIEARASAGGLEFSSVLDNALGIPLGARTAQAAIRSGQRGALSDAYARAYRTPIDYSSPAGQTLEGLWARVPEAARRQAAEIMRLDGDRSLQRMISVSDDGTPTISTMPDVRTWDYITRALNDMAESGETRGAMGGQTNMSRAVSGLSRTIRTILRRAVPEYNQALTTAAQPIRAIEAVEVGESLLQPSVTREMAREMVSGMTTPERAAARQGLRSYIDDLMARTQMALTDTNVDAREAVAAWRALSSRRARSNIRFLLGEETDDFLREVDRIATDFELRAAVAQNSRTAVRSATQRSAAEQAAPGLLDVLPETGSVPQAISAGVRSALGAQPGAQSAREAGLFTEIARALTQPRGAAEAARISRLVGQAVGQEPMREARAAAIARNASGLLGLGAYIGGTQAARGLLAQ